MKKLILPGLASATLFITTATAQSALTLRVNTITKELFLSGSATGTVYDLGDGVAQWTYDNGKSTNGLSGSNLVFSGTELFDATPGGVPTLGGSGELLASSGGQTLILTLRSANDAGIVTFTGSDDFVSYADGVLELDTIGQAQLEDSIGQTMSLSTFTPGFGNINIVGVPEPSTPLFGLLGCAALLYQRKRSSISKTDLAPI